MQIIHHLIIDMARPLPVAPVSTVQNDSNTRVIKIALLENGQPWSIPANITAAVAFRKPDGTKGLYDTLPDGTKAVTVEDSAVSAVLAPQVLTCPGEVTAAVVFHDEKLNQLAAFPVPIRVAANPAAGQAVSNDYYRYSTMADISEAVEAALASLEEGKQDFLAKAEAALQTVHDTATEDAPAIVCEAVGEVITVADAAIRPLKGLALYGKTTQNGTPTPEAPVELVSVGDSGTIGVTVKGKNLCDSAVFNEMKKNGNITTYDAATHKITFLDGNSAGKGRYTYAGKLPVGVNLVLSFDIRGTAGKIARCGWDNNKTRIVLSENYVRYHSVLYATTPTPAIVFYNGYGSENILGVGEFMQFDNVQLEIGDTATDYEPYKPIQTLTASTEGGLPGIPVSSGGNYTDEAGQQWICDEVDFAKGVYMQRTLTFPLPAKGSWAAEPTGTQGRVRFKLSLPNKAYSDAASSKILIPTLCNRFKAISSNDTYNLVEGVSIRNGYILMVYKDTLAEGTADDFKLWLAENPTTVLYPLAEPIETPLSAEELAAYAALHSSKPNTTVFNDSGTGMKLAYVADTKTYIDRKLAAISAAMLNA